MRMFTAIHLPDEVRAAWQEAQAELRARVSDARWTPVAQAHLTVHFLGEQPEERLEAIVAALRKSCAEAGPFELTLGQPGAFPRASRPRVVWLGLGGNRPALEALERGGRAGLASAGVALEDRPYAPHLTLAREPADARAASDWIACPAIDHLSWRVEALTLYKSTLRSQGALHEAIERFQLGGDPSR